MSDDPLAAAARSEFATTHWSLVVAAASGHAPEQRDALAQLCEIYWFPLYAYVRRSLGDIHQAQDVTQAFFTELLERRSLEMADSEHGRFRAFLLTACKRFLINEWHKGQAVKRGGGRRMLSLDFASGESKLGLVVADSLTAEQLFDRQWATTLLEQVMELLRAEYAAKDRLLHFTTLQPFLAGSPQRSAYSQAARTLGISETTAKVAAHRLRNRYRELLRDEIAQTVARPEGIDDEIRDLFAVLATPLK